MPAASTDQRTTTDGTASPDLASADGPTTTPPIGRADAWINYAYLATWSYLLYGVGNATPYLRSELHLSDFEAGLHGSAMAVGVLIAGVSVDRLARRVGPRRLLDLGIIVLILGVIFLAFSPTLPGSLTGALLLGLAGGMLGTQVNVNLSRSDLATSRRLLSQANAVSMVTAGAAPVVMGLAVQLAHAWRLALFVPVAAALGLSILQRYLVGQSLVQAEAREEATAALTPGARLPLAYWFVWVFLVLVVSIEFSFVFWGSTIVARQTGVADADATLLASLFVAGMFVGRASLGRGLGAAQGHRLVLTCGLIVVLVGASLVWVSSAPALSGLGLFLGGAGTAGLYPIGLAIAIDRGGRARFEAAARGTLASGVAVLLAPSLLGLASDMAGVAGAWPIILAIALGALVVLAIAPQGD